MEIRVVTMRYSEGVQGFPEDVLRRICAGHEVLDVSEHFFLYGNVPQLTLVVKLAYAIARNTLVLEIVKAMPQTLVALKEIDGVGEAMATNYGADILAILANAPKNATAEMSVEEAPKENSK